MLSVRRKQRGRGATGPYRRVGSVPNLQGSTSQREELVMRVLQGNLHRSRTADNLLAQLRLDLNIDLLVISEQYRDKNGPGWHTDALGTAAIWVPDTARYPIKKHGGGRGFVWVVSGGVTIVSCYFTPNEPIADFQEKLDVLEDVVRDMDGKVLVAGDFNARALEWGSTETDSRGRRILEMAARLGFGVMNEGDTSTFRRPGYGETIPDITLATDRAASTVGNWRVIEDYTGSDHQYIVFDLQTERHARTVYRGNTLGWNANRLNEELLESAINRGQCEAMQKTGPSEEVVDATMRLITRACNASMPRKSGSIGRRRPVYWWTDEIANLRRNCLQLRRRVTRGRRRQVEATANVLAEYKTAKKSLKTAINRSKRSKWEELRREVNIDPWGLGYKVVMRKLGTQTTGPPLAAGEMENIVDTLFPTHPLREEDARPDVGDVPLFTEEELTRAAGSLQNRKAPGPDGIPAEVMKVIARTRPELLLNMYNSCLREGVFSKRWKKQRLVLISKGKGNLDSPSAYRPLCMLDTAGKLLEKLLKPRLTAAIESAGDLSPRQHGFRRGHSTVAAVEEIVETFQAAQQGNHFSRRLVMLVTLDVKNAFNSARWCDMLDALKNFFRIPPYLQCMMESYLRDRELIYETTDGPRRRRITAGAAQGSILGPDLWNASYDGLLRLDMPEDTYLVGYADDIAAVITARDVERCQMKLNQVFRRVAQWMTQHGLSLATEKTEIVLLTRRRIPTTIQVRVGPEIIKTGKAVKYLGVRLDTKLTFFQQISAAADKAAKITGMLSKLMANTGGPTEGKRRLLMSVTQSILLYGSEVWADALKVEKYRGRMASVQRRGALRIASSYRTVSEPAVLVVAGVIPIDLLAAERKRIYANKSEVGKIAASAEARRITMQRWQERWNLEARGRWTRTLIGSLAEWTGRGHGRVNYYVTQFLTGHGYFAAYLNRMGKMESPACIYEDAPADDALHTFFECHRWRVARQRLERDIETEAIRPGNIVQIMLASEENWNLVAGYVEVVLKEKKREMG